MKLLGLSLLVFLSFFGHAQHSTLRFTDEPISFNQQSVLLVPFKSKMYLSDINRELAVENKLTTNEIIQRFTNGIDQSILFAFEKNCNIASFYQLEDDESAQDLNYIYDNLKLEYELVSSDQNEKGIVGLKKKFKKKEDQDYHGGEIRNGEVYTEKDTRERYMKAVVENNTMLDSMHYKFDNTYFLFITELDIRNQYADAISMQQMDYSREIKMHYTIYHKDGQILSTGVSVTSFPSSLNDINKIISGYFPILAQNIYDDLFPSESTEKASKLDLKLWK